MTPFQALYGRDPLNIARYVLGSTFDDLVEKYMLRPDDVLNHLKFTLAKEQNRMKDSTGKRRTDDQFKKSDWVFVK